VVLPLPPVLVIKGFGTMSTLRLAEPAERFAGTGIDLEAAKRAMLAALARWWLKGRKA
jgi:hypothetical protein